MAYTNTDTNMTTSSGLSAGMQTYYNRELRGRLNRIWFTCSLATSTACRRTAAW